MEPPFDMSMYHEGLFITHSNTRVECARRTKSRVSNVDPDTFFVYDMHVYYKSLGFTNVAEFFILGFLDGTS